MKLAFWKRKRSRRNSPDPAGANVDPAFEEAAEGADAATAAALVRVRTRRQLIGAFALLLAVVILVPMLLDPTPRAVPDNIPIDLPSDRTPFAPRLAAPAPAPAPAAAPAPSAAADSAAGVPAAPGSAADTAADAAPAGAASKDGEEPASAGKKHSTPSGEAAKGDAKHTAHKSDASAAGQGKIFVQAAAMSSESAAQKLAGRLAKSGLEPFVERTDTSDGVRYRVRLGPFASREDAERSLERLRALRVNANIVGA